MSAFFTELKRRNVVKVGVAYFVVAWVLMQATDILFPLFGIPDWGQRFVVILLAIGLPIALLLSWAYEVTPEGVKKTEEVDKSESITHSTGQKINRLITGGLLLVIALLLYDNFLTPSGPTSEEITAGQTSIAVLPFADLSAAGDQEYFGDGIAEELLNVLANVPNLRVAGRTSSFQFKGQNPDLRFIGETLGVKHILEGSVRTDGDQVRITVQLVSARDGFHVWSETFDREMTSIFAIQDEIAESIATALLGTLGAESLPDTRIGGTENIEVYDLYLKAKFARSIRSEENLQQTRALLNRAVALDPNFVNAWGALAKVYVLMQGYGFSSIEEARSGVNEAAAKALALDPENAEALASLGFFKQHVELDFLGARDLLERSLKSNPNEVEANHWYNIFLIETGQFRQALKSTKKTYELDPFYPVTIYTYVNILSVAGNIDEAKKVLDNVAEGQLGRRFEGFRLFYQLIFAMTEANRPEAERIIAEMEEQTGRRAGLFRYSLTRSEEDKKEAINQALSEYEAGNRSDMDMVIVFSTLGDYEAALPYTRKAVAIRDQNFLMLLMLGAYPDRDPRYWKPSGNLTPLFPYLAEYLAAYERAGIDIYELLQMEPPSEKNTGLSDTL